jgi:hypothetical protein
MSENAMDQGERERLGRAAFEAFWRDGVSCSGEGWEDLRGHAQALWCRVAAAVVATIRPAAPAARPAAPHPADAGERAAICPECGGCRDCLGTGRLWRWRTGLPREEIPCPRCSATAEPTGANP